MAISVVMFVANIIVIHSFCIAGSIKAQEGVCVKVWGAVSFFGAAPLTFNGMYTMHEIYAI